MAFFAKIFVLTKLLLASVQNLDGKKQTKIQCFHFDKSLA